MEGSYPHTGVQTHTKLHTHTPYTYKEYNKAQLEEQSQNAMKILDISVFFSMLVLYP